MGCLHSKARVSGAEGYDGKKKSEGIRQISVPNQSNENGSNIKENDDNFPEEEEEPPLLTLRPLESNEQLAGGPNFDVYVSSGSESGSDDLTEYDFLGYKARSVIGAGASSTVVKMEKEGVYYAVKVCDLSKFKPNFLQASTADPKMEAVLLKKFNYPYVVKMYDFCEDSDTNRFYLVMEYVDGGDIGKLQSENEKRNAFLQSILALNYVHKQRIVHRDIKVENILRHKDGSIRLADFGVSEFIPEKEEKKKLPVKGTPAYQAPEVNGDEPYNPFLTDIWSMGIMLYYIMFGKFPFMSTKLLDLHKKIAEDEMEFPKDASSQLVDLISKMCKKNPSERCTIDDIINHPWMEPAKQSVDLKKLYTSPTPLYLSIKPGERSSSIQIFQSSRGGSLLAAAKDAVAAVKAREAAEARNREHSTLKKGS